ncbi:MAG: hypothetical protein MJ188_02260 [Treponema sp.]|nr:hypothetical protein [Treponema sp.]
MINQKLKEMFFVFVEAVVIAGITLSAVLPVSCKVSTEGIQFLEGDYSPPLLLDFQVMDSFTLRLVFSEKVDLTGCVVSRVVKGLSDSGEHSGNEALSPSLSMACGENGSLEVEVLYGKEGIVDVIFAEEMVIAEKYELYGIVKDSIGNSLTFAVPFTGYNSRVAKIIMTEIQTESVSSQRSEEKKAGIYRNEFIEFLALSEGNLAGLKILSAYDGEEKAFEFPAVEVKTGEVFVVHLRNRGNGCISEIGDDLNVAYSAYASDGIRDLWTELTSTALGNKTDVIYVINQSSGKIIDGVMFHDGEIEEWSAKFVNHAELLYSEGFYEGSGIEYGSVTTGLTATKTLGRIGVLEMQQAVLNGEEVEYPLKNKCNEWIVLDESSCGKL